MDLNNKACDILDDMLRECLVSTGLARQAPGLSFVSLRAPKRTTFYTQVPHAEITF